MLDLQGRGLSDQAPTANFPLELVVKHPGEVEKISLFALPFDGGLKLEQHS